MNASRLTFFALTSLCLGLPLLAGCSSDATASAPDPETEGLAPEIGELRAKVGAAGGELVGAPNSAFAGVRLVVPAGALASETEIVIRASVDPVPLALTAERVGPQFSVEPAGLALAVPAKLTVPFDAELRAQWAQQDSDCKVWLRDGAGWTSAEQTASSPEGVTVELRSLTVAAAGVLVKPLQLSCVTMGTCTLLRDKDCLVGSNFCMRRLPPPTASAFTTNNLTVDNGFAYFLHSPAVNTFTVAKYNLASPTGETTLLTSLAATPSSPMVTKGRIAVGTNGEAWAGMVGYGNVRFSPAAAPFRFDSASTLQPAGVVIDDADRSAVVRLTRRVVPLCNLEAGGCTPGSLTGISLTGQKGALRWDIAGLSANELVFARPTPSKADGTSPPALPFAFMGTDHGVGDFVSGGVLTRKADPCGASLTVNFDLSPSGVRHVACANGHVFDDGGRDYALGTTVVSSMASDDELTAYVVDSARAELVQIHLVLEGGVQIRRLPLTTAAPGTPEHDRLLPRAIRFDKSTKSLVLVTRGLSTTGIPELYTISKLSF